MAPYFFRVEHDLLRSEAFKALGGSAIKVYLVVGLYSDFGTDWAYPSVRTIARQAGLSRHAHIHRRMYSGFASARRPFESAQACPRWNSSGSASKCGVIGRGQPRVSLICQRPVLS